MSEPFLQEEMHASVVVAVLGSNSTVATLSEIRLQKIVERLTTPTNVSRSSTRPKRARKPLRRDGEKIRDKTLPNYEL
jgi:hypothetical protein